MKYTFEIMKEYEDAFRGISVYSVSEDKKLMVDFVAREELEDAQKKIDEAYQKGLNDSKEYGLDEADMREAVSYQKGLDDAWEAARKIVCDDGIDMNTLCTIFRRGCSDSIIRDYSAAEAIAKLKAYEEQRADKVVKRGDVVRNKVNGLTYIVTLVSEGGYVLLDSDGNFATSCITNLFEKTGKHVDIDKILEAMKE